MPISIPLVPSVLQLALRAALAKLPEPQKTQAQEIFRTAHGHLLDVLAGNEPPPPAVPLEAALAHAAVDDDAHAELQNALQTSAISFPYVSADGTVFGFGQYEQLDPFWLLAMTAWLSDAVYDRYQPFPANPAQLDAGTDSATIAIVGDWGGANGPARAVADLIKAAKPDYAIHLGDVYYYGAKSPGLWNYEEHKLVKLWQPGTRGSFTLNSNHEMYAGAQGYFTNALTAPAFAAQQGTSYFSLCVGRYLIVGLDSGYFSPWESVYMAGALDESQLAFLRAQSANHPACDTLIVLTHHNGIAVGGDDNAEKTAIWDQLVGALPANRQVYWYWGHLHEAIAYDPITLPNGSTLYARCVGHGCVPFGASSALAATPSVQWYQTTPIPGQTLLMQNGYLSLTLTPTGLTETFINAHGSTAFHLP